jgi:hypothetical protein
VRVQRSRLAGGQPDKSIQAPARNGKAINVRRQPRSGPRRQARFLHLGRFW